MALQLTLNIPLQSMVNNMQEQKPPLPPFTKESAIIKVQAAEDAWNSKDPEKV